MLVNAGGTASQLTSRRPPFCSPTTLGLSGPSAVWKSVKAAVISHAAVKTDGCARSLALEDSDAAAAVALRPLDRLHQD